MTRAARPWANSRKVSSLATVKNFNYDFLLTYLVHPGTAVYLGYNTNLQNIAPELCLHIAGTNDCDPAGPGLLRSDAGAGIRIGISRLNAAVLRFDVAYALNNSSLSRCGVVFSFATSQAF